MPRARTRPATLLIATTLALSAPLAEAAAATLRIQVYNLRSAKGTILLCVWGKDGSAYPDCGKGQGVRQLSAPVTDKTVVIDVPDLEPGTHAVSLIHDENDDRKLNRGALGIPTEGVGFSNNPSANFGPPKFDRVTFQLTGDSTQQIRMKYYL